MSLLRIASAGATVAAAASLAGWFSPSVWLLLGAILSDLYRAGAGAKDAAAGWLVLVLAAGCIAFGTSSVVPVMLSLTGFVCLMRFGEGAGRTDRKSVV